MKEKMLMRLERDRMKARVSTLEAAIKQMKEVKKRAGQIMKKKLNLYTNEKHECLCLRVRVRVYNRWH
jgi:hypothetical protein